MVTWTLKRSVVYAYVSCSVPSRQVLPGWGNELHRLHKGLLVSIQPPLPASAATHQPNQRCWPAVAAQAVHVGSFAQQLLPAVHAQAAVTDSMWSFNRQAMKGTQSLLTSHPQLLESRTSGITVAENQLKSHASRFLLQVPWREVLSSKPATPEPMPSRHEHSRQTLDIKPCMR